MISLFNLDSFILLLAILTWFTLCLTC